MGIEFGERGMNHHQAVAIACRPTGGHVEHRRVAVDGNHPPRARRQQRPGIAARTEGAVDPGAGDR
jgi:hypothetical protein